MVICLQFPENYPNEILLIELKSKAIDDKFLENLSTVCEKKLKTDYLGEAQILPTINFINDNLSKTPLCVVYGEIKRLQKYIDELQNGDDFNAELVIKQKNSIVKLVCNGGEYHFKVNAFVPDEYPIKPIEWDSYRSNLPMVMTNYINGQAKEIARKCVEPSARNSENFQPQPNLFVTLKFLIEVTKLYFYQICPICGVRCLPNDSQQVVSNNSNGNFIERLICGHLYHQSCLVEFISEPPFKGKTCKAIIDGEVCGKRVMHHRWGENVAKAEARWAARESRKRELQDVMDFLQ